MRYVFSVFLLMMITLLVQPSAYAQDEAKCWWEVPSAIQAEGVSIEDGRAGSCRIRWGGWKSRLFTYHLHVYGIHDNEVFYVGGDKDGRQVFGHGRELAEPFQSIWYNPVVVNGKIFYAATNGYVGTEYQNTIVYGGRVYTYGVLGGIPQSGPVIWNDEPVMVVRLHDESWAVFVGDSRDERSFPSVSRWGAREPSIWQVRIKDGKLVYTAIDETGLVLNYEWGKQ